MKTFSRFHPGYWAMGLIALVTLMLVACGGAEQPTSAPASTKAPAAAAPAATVAPATAVPVATAAPTTVPAVQSSGELVISLTDLGNETPSVWQEYAFGKAYMRFLFDALTGTDDDGDVDKSAGVAKDWSMSTDAKTWTFQLRDNIKFHNGDPLTAEDVKFSIELMTSEDSVASYKTRIIASIDTSQLDAIKIVSPTELVINTKQPAAFLNWDLSDIQGVEGLVQPKNYTESIGVKEFANDPVGSGPYKWVGQRKGDFMEFEAVENHWRDGTPKWKTITFRIIPEESTRIAALKSGEVDVISVSRERAPELKAAGLNIHSKEGASILGLYFHEQWRDDSIWKDINVRKAFNLAVNRKELCEFIFAGQCSPASTYPWPDIAPGTDKTLKPYPFDPEEAKALLKASAYNGEEVAIRSYPRADVPEGPRFIEAVAAYLDVIGVNIKIIPTEYASYRKERLAHTLDNGMGYLAAPNRPLAGFVGLMRVLNHTKGAFTSSHDPEIDRLIEAMEVAIDSSDVEERSKDLSTYMYNQYTHLTCCNMNISYATNDKITEWNLGKRVWDDGFTYLYKN